MKSSIKISLIAVQLLAASSACRSQRPESPIFSKEKPPVSDDKKADTTQKPPLDNDEGNSKGSDPGQEEPQKGGSDKPDSEPEPKPEVKPNPEPEKRPEPEPKPEKEPEPSADAALRAACQPDEVEVKNQDAQASAIFAKAIPDAKKILTEIALSDCLQLFKNASEVRKQRKITVVIRDYEGVAYATPNNGEIHFSARYIKNFSAGKNDAAIKQEMYGVMTHEINHLYQYFWRDGKYTPFSEGICDAIRARAELYPPGRKRKGGNWMDSYTTTGYFLLYLDGIYPDFIYKMNKAAKNWNDGFWQQTTGKTVEQLWADYQKTF